MVLARAVALHLDAGQVFRITALDQLHDCAVLVGMVALAIDPSVGSLNG